MKQLGMVLVFLTMGDVAHAECSDPEVTTLVERAATAWQNEAGIFLHPSVLEELSSEACSAVEELVSTTPHGRDTYVSKIDTVTAAFLSSNSNANEALPFVAWLLESVSPGGFAFPEPVRWPTLVLEFNLEPDSVEIDNVHAVSPIFTYNITVGTVELRASRTGSQDCVHSIASEEGRNYRVRCDF